MHATQSKKAKPGKAGSIAQRAALSPTTAAAAQRMPAYSRGLVQPKVAVGPAGDSFENEADSVAQKIGSGGSIAPQSLSSVTPSALRAPADTKKEEKPVDKKPEKTDEKKPEPKPVQKADEKKAGKPPEPKSEEKTATKKDDAKPVQKAGSSQQDRKPEVGAVGAKPVQKKEIKADDKIAKEVKDPEKAVQKSEAKNAPGTASQQAAGHAPEGAAERPEHSATTPDSAHTDGNAMDTAAELAISQKGPGRPLNPATESKLSERMGMDFSHVRIHDGPAAQEAVKSLHARAFTHGSDIWLGAGESDSDITLVAHELTHVVQQSDHIHRKIVQRKDPPAGGKKPKAIGEIDTTGKGTVKIPTIDLPKFKAKGHSGGKSSYTSKPLTVAKRPTTEQKKKWIDGVTSGVSAKVADFFKGGGAAGGGAGASTRFLTTAPKGKKALAQWKKAGEGLAKQKEASATDIILFGTKEEITAETVIPYWTADGKEHNFDVDHIKEMQLGGTDDTSNYELLDWKANRSSGSGIRNELLRRFNEVVASNPAEAKTVGAADMDNFIKKGGTVEVKDFTDKLAVDSAHAEVYWSFSAVSKGDHLKKLRVLTEAEIAEAGLRGSDTHLSIFSSSGGGMPRFIPWTQGEKATDKAVKIPNFYHGFQLQTVTYTPTKTAGESIGRLKGQLFVKNNVFQGKAPAGEKEIKTDFSWSLKKSSSIEYGGYIDDTQILPTLLANFTKANALSPISWDGARLDDTQGIIATGSIQADVPLIKGVSIDFMLAGDEVRISKMFTAGDFSLPKPIAVTGATLELFASSKSGFGMKGDVNFEIEKLGTGYIKASATTGKNLAEAGIALEGGFDFESKLFDKAEIKASYKRDDAGNYAFGVQGLATIEKEGKVKGVKSASVSASYEKGKFVADGTAKLSIPGIKEAGLHVEYDEKEGMVISGDIALAENIPGIQSGSGKVTIKKKEGEDYHIGATGTVVPKIPGISAAIGFTVDDDIFTVEGTVGYEKGLLKGSIMVGATNRPVDADGKPGTGKPGKDVKDIKVYGGGSLTLKLTSWLQGTAGIKFKPDGNIEVMGEIALPSTLKLFDEKKLDKNLFKIKIDIPIIGISAAGHNIGIFATIGGGLDLSAGIGPGELQEARIGVTYDPNDESKTHVSGSAKFHIPAHAGLRLFVRGGLGAGIPIVSAEAGIEIGGELGLAGALDASVNVDWTPQNGIVLDAKGSIFVEPKFKFDVSAYLTVDLDLLLKTINLYEEHWQLASFEWGSGLRFGVEMPIHYEEGKPFDVSIDDLKFTTPQIEPGQLLGDLVKKIVG